MVVCLYRHERINCPCHLTSKSKEFKVINSILKCNCDGLIKLDTQIGGNLHPNSVLNKLIQQARKKILMFNSQIHAKIIFIEGMNHKQTQQIKDDLNNLQQKDID